MLETVNRLEARIAARFPERDLRQVAHELSVLVTQLRDGVGPLQQRLRNTRTASYVGAGLILAATLVALVLALRTAVRDGGVERGLDWLPLIESTINDLVFAAIALFFLWSLPERFHRGHTLKLLHQLRSLAHIIDMHQLTKDPERLRASFRPTSKSPQLDLDTAQMEHYLDYCSEMLSLVGKAAALVAEESRDAVVLDSVSNIETLTTGMSRKIWQKISVLDAGRRPGERPDSRVNRCRQGSPAGRSRRPRSGR